MDSSVAGVAGMCVGGLLLAVSSVDGVCGGSVSWLVSWGG